MWFQCKRVVGSQICALAALSRSTPASCNRRRSASVRALFDSWEYTCGDSGRLALLEPDAKMTRQLDDAPRRVGEQVFVALNEHVGLRHPEPIVGENLMDHPLAEQLLEGHASFMHQ